MIDYSVLGGCAPDSRDFRHLVNKMESGEISQIIFDLGKETVWCILEVLEKAEEYEKCAEIKNKIRIHNRVNNTNI